MGCESILKVLDETLPPVFRRKDVSKLTGGIITDKLLKALPKGAPSPPYTRFGKFVVYEKEQFLKWAEEYYAQFTEFYVSGFAGRKVRRVTGTKGETGDGSESDKGR